MEYHFGSKLCTFFRFRLLILEVLCKLRNNKTTKCILKSRDLTLQTSNFVVRVWGTSVSTSVSQIHDILYRFCKNFSVSYVTLRNLRFLFPFSMFKMCSYAIKLVVLTHENKVALQPRDIQTDIGKILI